jgi:acetyl-CoA carboxylase biotin carboxyl carrier protein
MATLRAVQATLAGTVLRIMVHEGDAVAAGQEVVILESMKMEIPVESEVAGTVREVPAKEGAFVNEGDPLLLVEVAGGGEA